MPDIHDGRELFSEPPPQGDLSVSPGSHTKPVRLLPQVAPQSCLTICPRVDAQAYPDTVFKREGRGDSASSAGLKLTTEPRQRASAFSPHATTDWTRLAQSVWQENRRFLEEVPLPRDTPAWLRSSPAFSPAPWSDKPLHESELEEVLPLHYGIRLDEHRVDSCRSIATVVAFQVTAPPPPPLLTFPFATLPPFSRTPTLPTPFEDGVLPFRAPVKQTLAIFSLTGGSGRTSIAAGLARLLAGSGLRVLLVDTSAFSLLPRLFGAVESRQGIIRNFVPASGEQNRMISLISLAVEPFAGDDYEQYRILQELQRHAARVDRVVWDLSGAPLDWAAKVLGAAPQILVPPASEYEFTHATARNPALSQPVPRRRPLPPSALCSQPLRRAGWAAPGHAAPLPEGTWQQTSPNSLAAQPADRRGTVPGPDDCRLRTRFVAGE